MSFWSRLFQIKNTQKSENQNKTVVAQESYPPTPVIDEDIPNSLDLGWYYSEKKDEFQMAKIKQKDRDTHFYVIGASGSGKTKFLEYLILQDIERGNGFGVIDPHGDLIEDIKGILSLHYSPRDEAIKEKIVLIDPTDPVYTVTFNPLEKLPGVSVSEQANELIGSFKKIWSDSWGVRMEDLMRNSLIALGEAELSLAELPIFLTNRNFRKSVLTKVTHSLTQDYFSRFDTMTDRSQITWIEPVMNKVNAFLSDDRIRQMFASNKGSFNIREIMDQKKILLVKLDKGKLKDSADLLGSLLMAKIQIAAFSRSDVPKTQRSPFYMYIDEFQNFASESFAVILSEARKYGLSLIMAHQTLAQISEELKSLILGNTGIQVYFRVNRHDAQLLAKEAFEYSGYEVKTTSMSGGAKYWSLGEEWEHHTEAFQNLPHRACYIKHKIAGGLISVSTAEIEPAWEVLGMAEDNYSEFLKSYLFGQNYLIQREELASLANERRQTFKQVEDSRLENNVVTMIPQISAKKATRPELKKPKATTDKEKTKIITPDFSDKNKSQHRYLQTLIKRMAEEKGFKAVVEQSVLDGAGRVDVSLERDSRRIACEIALTTTYDHELGNIEKCLAADYETVILCSPDNKNLEKIKALVNEKIASPRLEKILFLKPDDLFFYLEKEAASRAGKEERVKGYRVKVNYQPVVENEKSSRREAVGQVMLQALKRMKENT